MTIGKEPSREIRFPCSSILECATFWMQKISNFPRLHSSPQDSAHWEENHSRGMAWGKECRMLFTPLSASVLQFSHSWNICPNVAAGGRTHTGQKGVPLGIWCQEGVGMCGGRGERRGRQLHISFLKQIHQFPPNQGVGQRCEVGRSGGRREHRRIVGFLLHCRVTSRSWCVVSERSFLRRGTNVKGKSLLKNVS